MWFNMNEHPPPKKDKILVCLGDYSSDYWQGPVTATFRTFHANGKGKLCWRDLEGRKIVFRYWMPLPDPPKDA